jgi:hypothetical protein
MRGVAVGTDWNTGKKTGKGADTGIEVHIGDQGVEVAVHLSPDTTAGAGLVAEGGCLEAHPWTLSVASQEASAVAHSFSNKDRILVPPPPSLCFRDLGG